MLISDTKLLKNSDGNVITDHPTLWHCHDSRSLRPLWTLAEMGIDYDVVEMQFPPRVTQENYKQLNVLGTVPYFVDGEVHMTESTGICHYLVEKYQHNLLRLTPEHPEYGDYINWLYMSDATLLFPQTIVLRYSKLEPPQRRSEQVAKDYKQWFLARLKKLDQHILNREFLCGNRFTIADIAVGYALYLGYTQGYANEYSQQTQNYLTRLTQRPGFKSVASIGATLNPFLSHEHLTTSK